MADKPVVLAVDDTETNIDILLGILSDQYEVSVALDGETAIEIALADRPDIILLDIMMPNIDGFEVCRRLKLHEKTRNIPVIFVTAKSEVDDETRGFNLGAVDYITKPISPPILRARIKTHLQLKWAQEAMENQNRLLEEKVQERTRQLLHTERLATLGTFSAGIAHEIKNPNSFISGNIAFLRQFWTLAAPILATAVSDQPTSQVACFLKEIQPTLEGIDKGSQRINTIVDSLKSYATGNRGTGKQISPLIESVAEAQTLLQHRFKHGTQLIITVPDDLMLLCNVQEMSQVFINLFNNAMDAMDEHSSGKNRSIWVTAQLNETALHIFVKDSGPGVPKSVRETVFNPFFTTKGPTRGTGLGLSIVKGIVENHQGQITIVDHDPPGTTFELVFPLVPDVPRTHLDKTL